MKLPAWAQRNNEGPPDLDEVFRDLSKKINKLFGRNASGNSGNGNIPPADTKRMEFPIFPIVMLVVAIWMATGFYIVDQGSLGVEQRFGKYTGTTDPGPRWHWPFPFESVEVVNMEQVRRLEVGYRTNGEGDRKSVV